MRAEANLYWLRYRQPASGKQQAELRSGEVLCGLTLAAIVLYLNSKPRLSAGSGLEFPV